MKVFALVGPLFLPLVGCSSPMSVEQSPSVTISRLIPSAGPVNTSVTVVGHGFAASGNTVIFSSNVPPSPDFVPNLSSDGSTLVFTVPNHWTPECVYTTQCPIAYIPRAPGDYTVMVMNANGTSNAAAFSMTSEPTR